MTPFRFRFPSMFAISNELEASVAKCHEADGWHRTFRRTQGPREHVELVTLDAKD
jgi:hypothetical protein